MGVGGGVFCFIVVLFLQTCVGITTRTVLWPLGAKSGCVSYKCFLPRQLFACLQHLMNSAGMCVLVIIFCNQDALHSYTPFPQYSLSVCLSHCTACYCIHN